MRVRLMPLLLLLMVAAGDSKPSIEGLNVQREGQRLLVSFELVGAFDEEMLERVQSGLPTSLEYTLRLHRPRGWWFDKTYQRSTLEVVASYNGVTQEYQVHYTLDDKLIDSKVVSSVEALERSMTSILAVPVFELTEEPRARTQVMVRAELGSNHILLLFPNRISTNWARFRIGDLARPQD